MCVNKKQSSSSFLLPPSTPIKGPGPRRVGHNHWPPDRIYDNQSTTSSKPPIRSLLNSRRVVESLTCLLGGRGTCRAHSADNAFRPPPFRLQLTTNHKSLHPVDQPGFLPSTHVVLGFNSTCCKDGHLGGNYIVLISNVNCPYISEF